MCALRFRSQALIVALLSLPLALCAQEPANPASREPAKTAPQVQQVLPSYEGQNVSSVEVAGRPDVKKSDIASLLAQREGEPFSRAKVDQTVENLKQTGRFQDVQLQIVPDVNGVRVLLVLQPGLYFGVYEFPGALGRFSYTRLLQVANYPPEGPYSDVDVQNAQQAMLRFFQRSGYFLATVKPQVNSEPQRGIVNVTFQTELGKKAKFGEVSLQGATPEETARLQKKVKSLMARLKGAAIRRGKAYSPATLGNAAQYLEKALSSEDHLAAQVKLVGANYDPATNRADIVFHVNAGPVIHARTEGAHVWSWTRRKLLPIYSGLGADPELIQEGRFNLVSYFQSKGYFDSDVKVDVSKQANGESIVYHITKGPRHKVADVEIAGNQSLPESELAPHLAVKKAHFLSHGNYSEKLVRSSAKNLEGVYRAAGYSTAKVTPQVTKQGDNIRVTFRVEEGPQDVVAALEIKGNETLKPADIAPKGLNVVEGKAYSQKLVDEDRNQIIARYLELGYPTATFHATAKPVEKDPHHVRVTYQIYEGPRVVTSSVMTLGSQVTRQTFIDRTGKLRSGAPLSENDMLSAESRLFTPGIFDWTEVDPRRQITTQDHEDVVVKVHESKRNSLTYGFGFEVINRGGSVPSGTVAVPGLPPLGLSKDFKTSEKTFWGPRVSLEYSRKNMRGRAETMTFGALAGRLDQRGTATYQIPNFRGSSWSATANLLGEHNSENPIFSSDQGQAGFQFQKPLDAAKTKNVNVEYRFRETGITNLLIPDLIPAQDRHVRLSTFSGTFTRDTRDNSLDAHKGIYESFEMDMNPGVLGSSVSFAKFLGQAAYYKNVHKGTIWANSLRLGFEEPFAGSHVPLSESFFTGGGSTLRGFPLNGAGPQRTISACGSGGCSPITVPVGGKQLLILNSEFRIPLPIKQGLGVVAFYDGGNVFRSIGFHGQYANTVGAGLRYATPVGPVRIDLGHNLNAPPGIKTTQLFITLGQAF